MCVVVSRLPLQNSFASKYVHFQIHSLPNPFALKYVHFKILSLQNLFTCKSFLFEICSIPNPSVFTSKSTHFEICSLPNPLTSKSTHLEICSLPNPLTSKSFHFEVCSLPNPLTSKCSLPNLFASKFVDPVQGSCLLRVNARLYTYLGLGLNIFLHLSAYLYTRVVGMHSYSYGCTLLESRSVLSVSRQETKELLVPLRFLLNAFSSH